MQVIIIYIMLVSFKCMVFHKQNVVNKRKKRNFNLTKNSTNSEAPDYFYNKFIPICKIIITF